MKFLIIIFMFFVLFALLIISNNNLKMSEQKSINSFSKLYSGWINNIYENAQTLTGEIIKLSWAPEK